MDIGSIVLKITGGILGVIILYNLVTHGTAVSQELTAAGNFVSTESKVLEGR